MVIRKFSSAPNFIALKSYCDIFFSWQLIINMHTINAVFLLGDTALNSLVSDEKQLHFASLVISWLSSYTSQLFSDSHGFESDISSSGQSFT